MFQKCHKFYPTFVQIYHVSTKYIIYHVSTMNHLSKIHHRSTIYHVSHNIPCVHNKPPQSSMCPQYTICPQYTSAWHLTYLVCLHQFFFVAFDLLLERCFVFLCFPRCHRRGIVVALLFPVISVPDDHINQKGNKKRTLVLSRSVKHCTENHTTAGSIAWLDTPRYRTNSTNM